MTFVCFDLNETLITNATWLQLNTTLGVTKEEDKELLRLCEDGKLSYREGQKRLEILYRKRGKATEVNIKAILSDYTFLPGVREMITYLQMKNFTLAILSNSIDLLVKDVARHLHIPYAVSNNQFIFDGRGWLKEIIVTDDAAHFKWKQLQRLCRKVNSTPRDSFYIGDGEDDREIFLHTKRGITFLDSPVAPVAWKTIDRLTDLKKIL